MVLDCETEPDACKLRQTAPGVPTFVLIALMLPSGCGNVVATADGGATSTSTAPACTTPSQCPGADTACQHRTCESGTCGLTNTPAATPLPATDQLPGDCQRAICDGAGNITTEPDDTDLPDDANACTANLCTAGVPSHPPEPTGTLCGPAAICDGAGQCVGCISPTDCPGTDTDCQQRACASGVCGITFSPALTPLPVSFQISGDCQLAVCDGAGGTTTTADDTDPPASPACAATVCANGSSSTTPLPAGTPCAESGGELCDGAGGCVECNQGYECTSGVCQSHTCQAPTCSDGVLNQGELGTDCGGPCSAKCPTIALLGVSPTGTFAATYHPGAGWMTTTTLGGAGVDAPSLAFLGDGTAIGAMRYSKAGDPADGQIQYTTWAAEAWSPYVDVPGVVSTHQPSVSAGATSASAAYRGLDGKYYFLSWAGGAWSSPQPVVSEGIHSAGISAPTFTQGAGVLGFVGHQADCQLRRLNGLTWESYSTSAFNFLPEDVAPSSMTLPTGLAIVSFGGLDVLEVIRQHGGPGSYVFDADIGMAPTMTQAGMAPLPNGRIIVAAARLYSFEIMYRVFNGSYWANTDILPTPGLSVTAPVVLAPGVGGADAELVFVATDGVAYHMRMIGNTWTSPASIGGVNLTRVAIASAP